MGDSPSVFNNTSLAGDVDEMLWLMFQQSRSLQDLRRDISHVWDDTAARDVNSRYLNSHEEDDNRIKISLHEQKSLLEQADRKLGAAEDFAREIDECAALVTEKLRFAEQDMENAYSHYDLYVQYNSDARLKFPLVRELINHANNACG